MYTTTSIHPTWYTNHCRPASFGIISDSFKGRFLLCSIELPCPHSRPLGTPEIQSLPGHITFPI